METSTAPES